MSGVILFSETVCQHATKERKNFVELLKEKGIFAGIKVGKGLGVIPGTQDESATLGLDSLANMAAEHYKLGCRFVKWRAVLKIGNGLPPQQAINENAWGLVRYAAICQENGLVPIVEPEILADEDHSIDVCVFKTLNENNVFLEGFLLKTNLVAPGATNSDISKVTPQEIDIELLQL